MVIAIFDNVFDGGAKRVVFEQLKHLSRRHQIHYFSNQRRSYFDFDAYATKVYRCDLELYSHQGIFRPLQELSFATHVMCNYRDIAQVMHSVADYAIIHPSHIEQAPALLSYLTIPHLYYVEEWLRVYYEPDSHPIEIDQPLQRRYEVLRRQFFRLIDWASARSARTIICNSQFTSTNVNKAYRRAGNVIYPGVDTLYFRPMSSVQRKHFLFIGQRHAINGFDLVQAALDESELPFDIAYVEPGKSGLYLTDAELLELYQKSVACLCLGKKEPFGLSALESMACGTPVIAVNEGGYAETVVHGETGILIEREPLQLIDAMKKLAVDSDLREKLALQARSHVEKHFTWEKHIKQIEKLIAS